MVIRLFTYSARRLVLPALIVASVAAKPILPQIIFRSGPVLAPAENVSFEPPVTEPQFDSTINPLPANVASIGFHITGTSEFGDLVRLGGVAHYIDSITVTLSSWAIQSDFPGSSPLGFMHDITLKLYTVDRGSGAPAAGAVLTTLKTTVLVPWRPEPDASAPNSPLRPWRAADGNYYGGRAFNVTFDLNAIADALPDEVIYGVSFDTERAGAKPLGIDGPYNSLGVGVSATPPNPGVDVVPGTVYWKTTDGAAYTDNGASGVNVFRADAGWTVFSPAVRFNNSPYGSLANLATRLMDLQPVSPDVARALAEARKLVTNALQRSMWENNRQFRAEWGQLGFDLFVEIAGELATIANSRERIAPEAAEIADSLLRVAEALTDSVVGDALIVGRNAHRVGTAQLALDASVDARLDGRYDLAIFELGRAWREAQAALQR